MEQTRLKEGTREEIMNRTYVNWTNKSFKNGKWFNEPKAFIYYDKIGGRLKEILTLKEFNKKYFPLQLMLGII